MTTTAAPKTKKEALTLKGGVFTLTTIMLHTTEPNELDFLLTEKIKIAPKFFYFAPVVLDCSLLDQSNCVDFKTISQLLKKHQLIPVGVRALKTEWQNEAIAHNLAIMPESRHAKERDILSSASSTTDAPPPEAKAAKQKPVLTSTPTVSVPSDSQSSPTRVITQPIRSGQQIYAPGGDLLVLAPVSHGAELLADGNIFVFGPLRGRALAGISGDQTAMIFCKSLEAELVSIAGSYKISEDLKEIRWKEAVRIQLQDGRLQFSEL